MTILVTGASGFVGQSIRGPDIIPFVGDIRDAALVRATIAAVQPSAVIHLAAIASPRAAARDAAAAWDVNLRGTFNIAQAILEQAPQARLVFAGSSEAYGQSLAEANGTPIKEDAPLRPLSRYGATKAAAETMLMQMAHEGLRVTCFRPFNHSGERQSETYVLPAFAKQIALIERGLQEPIIRTGNLEVARDFVDVEDVVRAYLLVARAEDDLAIGEIYNLASGRPSLLRSLLEHLLSWSTADIAFEPDPQLTRANEIAIIAGDPEKARTALGWVPQWSIDLTLKRVLDHWRLFVSK